MFATANIVSALRYEHTNLLYLGESTKFNVINEIKQFNLIFKVGIVIMTNIEW